MRQLRRLCLIIRLLLRAGATAAHKGRELRHHLLLFDLVCVGVRATVGSEVLVLTGRHRPSPGGKKRSTRRR